MKQNPLNAKLVEGVLGLTKLPGAGALRDMDRLSRVLHDESSSDSGGHIHELQSRSEQLRTQLDSQALKSL